MPAKAAEFASAEMRRVVPMNAASWPVLDMIFLGMGEDDRRVFALKHGADQHICAATHAQAPELECAGHHPQLRLVEHNCVEPAKAILLGASNSWFPTPLSALSIPRATDKLGRLVEERPRLGE